MLIRVKVKTKAKREVVTSKAKDQLEVSLTEKPERNMANKRLVEVLSEYFACPANEIRIVRGHKTPSKIVSIGGNDPDPGLL